jgi:regulator of sigma E protease
MSTVFLGGLVFIVVFAGSILVHELGHFIVARLLHIEVDEFGIGFPPRLVKLFRWKGTDFSLNWIPLGGFNRIRGEDDPAIPGGMAAANPWKRIAVMLAGAGMNLLTAVVTFSLLINQTGIPDKVIILDVSPDSPAGRAGILPGDVITQVGGQEIHAFSQLQAYAASHLEMTVALTIQRGKQLIPVSLVPRRNPPQGQGAMGVLIDANPVHAYRRVSSWFETIPYSFQLTGQAIGELLSLPGRLIAGTLPAQDAQIAGPRSIWNLFQQAVSRDVQSRETTGTPSQPVEPTNYTLIVIIELTISLAVINLLPIPALDGGRIFMILPELLLRRPIPAKYQAMINGIGFIVLLTLLGFFYIKDLINPLTINLP